MRRRGRPAGGLVVAVLLIVWLLGSYLLTFQTEFGRDVYCAGRIDAFEVPALSPCR